MKRFGFAIRTGGDPEIAGALARGIQMGSPTGADAPPPRCGREALGEQAGEAVRRVAMMRHTPEEWEAMTVQARYDYGQDPPTPRWIERLLVGYAMICMGVSWLYHLQDRLLKRRTV